MDDQQQHLKSALEQQKQLGSEIQDLTNQLTVKREMFVKLQGIIEYLTQLGVAVQTEEPSETVDTDPEE